MKKSKLELYEDILERLAAKPSTIDAIAFAGNMDCILLRQRINFLIANDLVEEREYETKTLYALTRRGLAIFKTLTLTKRLEKLQTNVKKMDHEVQAIQAPPEVCGKSKRKII